jgi:hypothetical protein
MKYKVGKGSSLSLDSLQTTRAYKNEIFRIYRLVEHIKNEIFRIPSEKYYGKEKQKNYET